MPRRYEEEINEILHKFDDWPSGNARGQQARHETPRRRDPLLGFGQFVEQLGPQQLMGIGLLLILVGVLLHFGRGFGMTVGLGLGTYATAIGFLILFAGYILAVVHGGGGLRRGQQVWRGQVIDMRPAGRGLAYWWWRLRAGLRNGRR